MANPAPLKHKSGEMARRDDPYTEEYAEADYGDEDVPPAAQDAFDRGNVGQFS